MKSISTNGAKEKQVSENVSMIYSFPLMMPPI